MGVLDRQKVIALAKESYSMESLAEKLDGDDTPGFWKYVAKICPGFDLLVQRNEVFAEIIRRKAEGGSVSTLRKQGLHLTADILEMGLSNPLMAAAPSDYGLSGDEIPSQKKAETGREKPKRKPGRPAGSKNKEPRKKKAKINGDSVPMVAGIELSKLEAVPPEDIKCIAIRDDILGYTGQEYLGRKVVLVNLTPGTFGEGCITRETKKQLTLHNGILNHSDIRFDSPPTTYWAALDAMSDLGQFTKAAIIEKSYEKMVSAGWRPKEFSAAEVAGIRKGWTPGSKKPSDWMFVDESEQTIRPMTAEEQHQKLREACGTAYDVLKTHMSHPTKRRSGMSHMCEDIITDDEKKAVVIRGRKATETIEYYDQLREDLKRSRATGGPVRSAVVKDPV